MSGAVNKVNHFFFSLLDVPTPWALGFQEPITPIMEGIINFHHDLFTFMIAICFFVFTLLFKTIYKFRHTITQKLRYLFREHAGIEVTWTLIPTLILLFIVFPSLSLLFATEDSAKEPYSTYQIKGHQWYWTFEYKDAPIIDDEVKCFQQQSTMIATADLKEGEDRLLKVDKPLYIPARVPVRFLMTSEDVIHSFAIPSAGIKLDCTPGRLTQMIISFKRSGVVFGQCSEICGVNHALMPIEVIVLEPEEYIPFLLDYFNYLKDNYVTDLELWIPRVRPEEVKPVEEKPKEEKTFGGFLIWIGQHIWDYTVYSWEVIKREAVASYYRDKNYDWGASMGSDEKKELADPRPSDNDGLDFPAGEDPRTDPETLSKLCDQRDLENFPNMEEFIG